MSQEDDVLNLRERGIYCLPNGRELVVLGKNGHPNALFRLGGWDRFELTEYEVDVEGRLVSQGRPTAWDIADLKDTGRSAHELAHPLDRAVTDSGAGPE